MAMVRGEILQGNPSRHATQFYVDYVLQDIDVCVYQRKLPPIPTEGCHPDQAKLPPNRSVATLE
jgi:hypothetical protein